MLKYIFKYYHELFIINHFYLKITSFESHFSVQR